MQTSLRQLRTFVRRAMGWIERHLDEFDPFFYVGGYEMKNGQRLGELGILLRTLTSLDSRHGSPEARQIVRLLQRVQRRRDYADRLMRSPAELILFAEVYASLKAAGIDSPEQHALIQRAIDAGYLQFTERLPHRMMDVVSCLQEGGFRHPLPTLRELLKVSVLARVPCPMSLNEDALYFLTHIIMFITDFGARPARILSRGFSVAVKPALDAMIVDMCQEHHWDLLAELLLCHDCLGLPHDDTYLRGWSDLIGMQRGDGSIPGPEWAMKLHQEVAQPADAPPRENFAFTHYYHTTLVSVIAGCARLKRARESCEPPRGSIRVVGKSLLRSDFAERHIMASLQLSQRWLEELVHSRDFQKEADANARYSAMLALWVCQSRTGNTAQGYAGVMHTMSDSDSTSSAPVAVRLMVGALLRDAGIIWRGLNDDDGFVKQAAGVLAATPPTDARSDLLLCEKRVLLYCLGLHSEPEALDVAGLQAEFDAFHLSGSEEQVNALSLCGRSHTLHGVRPPAHPAQSQPIAATLCALAMSRFRRYDIPAGCSLLRSALYLGASGINIQTSLDWLVLNQRLDGSFGFLGGEEQKLFGQVPSNANSKRDPNVALYLPITLECVWTLAEALDGWRLFSALPRWR